MPTMQFTLSSFTNKNADLKAGNTFTAYASGDGVSTAMILAARITLNNIRVYSTQCYLDMIKGGGTGKTVVFGQNANIHNQTVSLVEFSHALIQTGAGTVSFTVRASAGSTGNLLNLRDNVSGVLEIDYFIPQSDYSLDKAEVIAGEAITATISPTHPNAEHETTWRFQTQYQSYQASHYESAHHSAPFNEALTVPADWLKAIPDKESDTASITVDTYMNGVKTGTVVKYFTIKAGPGVIPGLNTLSLAAARINNGVPDAWGIYVQGISGVRLTGSGITGIYDSWITEVKITGAGYEGAGSPYDTGPVNVAGNVAFVCEITDSRGKKNTASVSVFFVAYSTPQMLDLDVVRCLPDGTPDNSGDYVLITPAYAINSVNGHNALTSMVTSKRLYAGGDYGQISTQAVASGQSFTVGGFDQNIHYVVKVVIADTFSTAETVVLVPAQQFLLHYRYGGKGVAIGMIAQRENAFEVNPDWEIFYKGQTLDQRFGGIDIPSIWPVVSGGTGLDNVPAGNYLKGNGTGALVPRTPAQVRADIGALALTGGALTGALTVGGILRDSRITTGNTQLVNTDGPNIYVGNPATMLVLESIANPLVSIGGVARTLYHTGNANFVSKTGDTMSGLLGIVANGYSLTLGSEGYNAAHYTTDASLHYFNKPIYIAGEFYANGPNYKKVFHSGDTIGAANLSGVLPLTGGALTGALDLGTAETTALLPINIRRVAAGVVGNARFSMQNQAELVATIDTIRDGITVNYMRLHGNYSTFGKPLNLAGGGTGAATGAEACNNIGAVKKSGDTMSERLTIASNGYSLTLGSEGYNVAHYITSAASHYFNKQLLVVGEIYAGVDYKRVYHAGNLTYGPGEPAGGADGDIYLQHMS